MADEEAAPAKFSFADLFGEAPDVEEEEVVAVLPAPPAPAPPPPAAAVAGAAPPAPPAPRPALPTTTLGLPDVPCGEPVLSGWPTRATTVRLPNIVTLAATAFDPSHYNEEEEDAELAAKGKLHAKQAVVRWRLGGEGAAARSSNTRVLRWSDGSTTLHIDSQVFLLAAQKIDADSSTLFARASGAPAEGGGRVPLLLGGVGVGSRLTIRAVEGSALAANSVLSVRMGGTTRPGGAGAASRPHRGLMPQVEITDTDARARRARLAVEEAAARAREDLRRRTVGAAAKEAALLGAKGGSGGGGGGGGGEDEGDDVIDLGAITGRGKRGGGKRGGGKRGAPAKRRRTSDVSEEEEEEEEDDEEEDSE